MTGLADATWPEAADLIATGALAVLPVGAVEQHGPHLPLDTDTVLATGVATRLAAGIGGIVLPAISYGDARTAEGWPGTLSIQPETLRAIVIDIGTGLRRMEFSALVIVNGHFGNAAPLASASEALAAAGLPVLVLDYPDLEELAACICDSRPAAPGFYHADEVETSMMLALAPDLVRMDRALAEYPAFPVDFAPGDPLHTFNRSGVFGDPRTASAVKGEALIAGIVAAQTRLVSEFRVRNKLIAAS